MADSPKDIRDGIQLAIGKLVGEAAQRNAVVRILANLGHRSAPSVVSARLDGDVLRMYLWKGSPAGDIILATGPAFLPKILTPSDISEERPGVYVLAGSDKTKAASAVGNYASKYKAPTPSRAVPKPAKPEGPKRTAAVAKAVASLDLPKAAPAAPPSVEQQEMAMLGAFLQGILKERK